MELLNAIEEELPLWKYFSNVFWWAEGDSYNVRDAWIECFGIHPKCWSFENVKRIGEKWGTILHVHHDNNGVNSLTYARMLVRTKAQYNIDARLSLEWDSGSCRIWVRETASCVCKVVQRSKQSGKNESEINKEACEIVECGEAALMQEGNKKSDTVTNNVENAVDLTVNIDTWWEPSNDEIIVLVSSCPVAPYDNSWFDPISSLECSLNTLSPEPYSVVSTKNMTQKRQRGRLKEVACSLPIPLFVPS
ncbi:unnamed protein product [Amaranthus hypochondriacus]